MQQLDKKAIIRAFNKAAKAYDQAAVLQREVCQRLLERLHWIRLQPTTILDLGSGTGEATMGLRKLYPRARIISLDIAFEMLHYARHKLGVDQKVTKNIWQRFWGSTDSQGVMDFITADAEAIPLKDKSVDLVFSSLSLQWCENYLHLFRELHRIMRPGGCLLYASFGHDTLKELRQSWAQVSEHEHVHHFTDLHDLGDDMLQSGWLDPVMDSEKIIMEYSDVMQLLKDLQQIGAQNHLLQRSRGLLGKKKISQMLAHYQQFQMQNGKFPATYEVVYGHAWARDLSLGKARDIPTQAVPVQFYSRKT